MKAYTVSVDDMVCITFAKNRSAAKWNALRAAREAGFYSRGREFPSTLQAWRAPSHDKHYREEYGRRALSEETFWT